MTDGHAFGAPLVPPSVKDGFRLDDGTRVWSCSRCGVRVHGPIAAGPPNTPNPCHGQMPHLIKHDRKRERNQWTAIAPRGRLGPDFDSREQAVACLASVGATETDGKPRHHGPHITVWEYWRPGQPPTRRYWSS